MNTTENKMDTTEKRRVHLTMEKPIESINDLYELMRYATDEAKLNNTLPVLIQWGDVTYPVKTTYNIIDECWHFILDDGLELNRSRFVDLVEKEAGDDCWCSDIHVAPFDAVTACMMYFYKTEDDVDDVDVPPGHAVNARITQDAITLLVIDLES